jgi:hypothetical protein
MNTLILIVVLLPVAFIVWRLLSKRDDGDVIWKHIPVERFALVRYRPSHFSEKTARNKAAELRSLRVLVLAELQRIYGESARCHIETLTLDLEHTKPAEWTHIVARKLTVNPRFGKHRAHFAEEIHNLYRLERFGMLHIYKPVNAEDGQRRELAQEFCRGV